MKKGMRNILAIVLSVGMLFMGIPIAHAATVHGDVVYTTSVSATANDNVAFSIYSDGYSELTGTGNTMDSSLNVKAGLTNTTKCTSLYIGSGVNKVGIDLFNGFSNLASVTVADGVGTLRGRSLANTTKLTDINFLGDSTLIESAAFQGSKLLSWWVDGSGLVIVSNGRYLLSYTGTSGNIVIPNGVVNISAGFFTNSTQVNNLKQITFPTTLRYLDGSFFGVDLTYTALGLTSNIVYATEGTFPVNLGDSLPDDGNGFHILGKWLFKYTGASKTPVIPDGIEHIYTKAFYANTSITSVTMPDTVKELGSSAFEGCKNLSSVTVSSTLEKVARSAFSGIAVTSLTLPSTIKSVDSWALACPKLADIWFYSKDAILTSGLFSSANTSPAKVTNVHCYAGSTMYKSYQNYTTKTVLPEILGTWDIGEVPGTVTATLDTAGFLEVSGTGAIKDFDPGTVFSDTLKGSVTSIKIDPGVTSIGDYAFQGLSSCSNVDFGGVTKIGAYIFRNSGVTRVDLPNSLTTVKDNAFGGSLIQDISYSGTAANAIVNAKLQDTALSKLYVLGNRIANYSNPKIVLTYAWGNSVVVNSSDISITASTSDSLDAVYSGQSFTLVVPAIKVHDINPFIDESKSYLIIDTPAFSVTHSGADASYINKVTDFYYIFTNDVQSVSVGASMVSSYTTTMRYHISSLYRDNAINSFTLTGFDSDGASVDLSGLYLGASVSSINTAGIKIAAGANVRDKTYAYDYFSKNNLPYMIVQDTLPSGVFLDKQNVNLIQGSSITLYATVFPMEATNKNVGWVSSNPSVATVDSNGTVTAVSPGSCYVSVATAVGGNTASCNVTVVPPPVKITDISCEDIQIKKGQTGTLVPVIAPVNADNQALKYTSSDSSVVSVSAQGVVTGITAGSAQVSIASQDGSGIVKTVNVTVVNPDPLTLALALNVSGPTNGTVGIVVGITGDLSKVTLPSGLSAESKSLIYNVDTNGEYTFTVKDVYGNVVTKTITVSNIDKTPPVLKVNSTYNTDGTDYAVDATDVGSGVDHVVLPDGTSADVSQLPLTYTRNGIGDVTFVAVDKAGNTVSQVYTRQTVSINNSAAPTLLAYEGIPQSWTNTSANVTLAAYNPVDGVSLSATTDTQKLSKLSESLTPLAGESTTGKVDALSIGKVVMDSNGSINITLRDGLGNTYDTSLPVTKIDKDIPEATSTSSGNVYTVSATDALSGVKSITDPSGKTTLEDVASYTSADANPISLIFTITDNAGNVAQYDAVKNKSEDVTPPNTNPPVNPGTPSIGDNGGNSKPVNPEDNKPEVPGDNQSGSTTNLPVNPGSAQGDSHTEAPAGDSINDVSITVPTVLSFYRSASGKMESTKIVFKSSGNLKLDVKINGIKALDSEALSIGGSHHVYMGSAKVEAPGDLVATLPKAGNSHKQVYLSSGGSDSWNDVKKKIYNYGVSWLIE